MTWRKSSLLILCLLLLPPLLVDGWPLVLSLWDKAESSERLESSVKPSKRNTKHEELHEVRGLFVSQFSNPKEVIAVLLLIGADVIQKAAAQLTRGPNDIFTPVVFSFGWVAYAFNSIAAAVGNGVFLPEPDYPCTVVNVGSGDRRENQSWVLGRLLRDLELKVEGKGNRMELKSGLLVTVYKAAVDPNGNYGPHHPKKDIWWYSFLFWIALQLGIAAIPCALRLNWSIIAMTAAGNILAWLTMLPPSMRQEKYQGKSNSRSTYALTQGNGHKHVFILLPDTLECEIVEGDPDPKNPASALPYLDQMASNRHRADWQTRIWSVFFAACWVMFLITVAGLEKDTWYLFGVGAVGMIHNILMSALPRSSEAHGIPLTPVATEDHGTLGRRGIGAGSPSPQVRQVLIELEINFPGAGHSLREIFFPGRPSIDDNAAWDAPANSKTTIEARHTVRKATIWP